MSNNVVFLEQLDGTLKELLHLGYSIIEDAYLLELDNLSQTASAMGFDSLRALIEQLYASCKNYLRLNNEATAMEITKSIALLQFALSNLNLGVGASDVSDESIEQMLSSLNSEEPSSAE